MKALMDGLRALGPARLAAMGAVALGMLGMLALMALRGGSDQMALLYGDLDLRDSAQVVDQLVRRHIPYRIAVNGTQILVPADQVPEARLALAKDGLPASGSVGYEIFDRGEGLAATEFQQKITRRARWKARSPARSARCRACATSASIWCCHAANRSPAIGRRHRPASC
jgi:flagellar M-ring protein FliF